jgi:hypothetical protein
MSSGIARGARVLQGYAAKNRFLGLYVNVQHPHKYARTCAARSCATQTPLAAPGASACPPTPRACPSPPHSCQRAPYLMAHPSHHTIPLAMFPFPSYRLPPSVLSFPVIQSSTVLPSSVVPSPAPCQFAVPFLSSLHASPHSQLHEYPWVYPLPANPARDVSSPAVSLSTARHPPPHRLSSSSLLPFLFLRLLSKPAPYSFLFPFTPALARSSALCLSGDIGILPQLIFIFVHPRSNLERKSI